MHHLLFVPQLGLFKTLPILLGAHTTAEPDSSWLSPLEAFCHHCGQDQCLWVCPWAPPSNSSAVRDLECDNISGPSNSILGLPALTAHPALLPLGHLHLSSPVLAGQE